MRYLILVPPAPCDPRMLNLSSMADLNEKLPIVMDCESEQQAVQYVRHRHPHAVAMPIPAPIGSGDLILLGMVEDASRHVSADEMIPCVMFVYAQPTSDSERNAVRSKPGSVFHRKLWKVPVARPELARDYRVDLRATDLEVPSFTDAQVGYVNGRLALYVEVGGIEMSMIFRDVMRLDDLRRSDAPPMLTPDVSGISSELGNHSLEP